MGFVTKTKEKYLKWTVVIAVILFSIGVLLLSYKPNGLVFVIASSLIQLGITIFVIDLVISRLGSRLFQEQIMFSFRNILGIENPKNKLFPELIRLLKPHPYHVLKIKTINKLFYVPKNKNKAYNMAIIEKVYVEVQAQEDNVQYNFFRGTDTSSNSPKLKEIKMDKLLLDLKEDVLVGEKNNENIIKYCVKLPMKKDKIYSFELTFLFPTCMGDLNHGSVEEDYISQKFIEFTNKSTQKIIFPFNLKNYSFIVKRRDASLREQLLKPKIKNNIVLIEEENLYNSERIEIIYKKKIK